MYFRLTIIITALLLSSCSNWVFRYDIPQGNYIDKKSIDKLQVGMTKEQVLFVLGSPVVVDAFNNDTWHYVYTLKSGKHSDYDLNKKLIINFSNDKLISATGDYTMSDKFNTPFNANPSTEEKTNDEASNAEVTVTTESKQAVE